MQINEFSDIRYELDADGIVTLSFATPARKNAISGLTSLELYWAAKHFQRDDAALAMILTGTPDPACGVERQAFSSGGYFDPAIYENLPADIVSQIDIHDIAMKRTTLAFFECDKPVLAAVNGLAIGAGITLPLAVADQIFVSEHAWALMPFARLGLAAELGSTYLLPALLGVQKAKELLFYPDRLSARQLVELGLVNAVLPHDELLAFTREKALQLIPPQGAYASIRAMKRIINQQRTNALSAALDLENEALNQLMGSADFAEGQLARIEKRPPRFTGR